MAEDIKEKLANYRTAPFDSRFPNQNQTKNCWQNYVGQSEATEIVNIFRNEDWHTVCQKALSAKGVDMTPCDWYKRVYTSLCPIAWVENWDTQREEGSFPGKI